MEGSDLSTAQDPFEPPANRNNDTKKRQLVTRSGLPRLHHKWAMKSPAAVRQFFKTVQQHMCHFEVDVIAGDANAAANKYHQNQERQDLYDSSVAVMLREMQREVNTGHPLGSKLHIAYSTNNHPTQLHEADDLACCFLATLSWRKPVGPRILRKLWSNVTWVSPKICVSKQTTKKGSTKLESPGAPKQGPLVATNRLSWHLPILITIREEPSKNYRSRTTEKWKAKEAKKQKINEWNHTDKQRSSWSWQQPMTWTSSSSSSWQQWSSDQKRARSDWQPSARTHRVSVLDGDYRVPDSRHSHGSEGPHLRGPLHGHS